MKMKKICWWVALVVLLCGYLYSATVVYCEHRYQEKCFVDYGNALYEAFPNPTNEILDLTDVKFDCGVGEPQTLTFLMLNMGIANTGMKKFGALHLACSIALLSFLGGSYLLSKRSRLTPFSLVRS